ncbi:MAG: molybdopterin oxidoreductase [Crocinitomicaceae bacterium]|nr:molybdopterin oxidoreductase [Crocinitomicaceae bacterium]|tara:strand:- start:245 stop:3568 length:3324 start_codon:yes stop_codon:yes gene_type:complete
MSTKKTYWKGYSEKNQTPNFVESSQKEFQDHVPVDQFLSSDGVNDLKTGRRDFLKFMGFSVAAATLASCEAPVIKSIPYVNKPEEITPGVANWYSSTFYDGNDFANVLVKSREGRPIWLKGKRDGYTSGGLIPRISTSILNLYNEKRLELPQQNGANSQWDKVDKNIIQELKEINDKNGKVRILSNTIISPSTNSVIKDFIDSSSNNNIKHVQYDAKSYNGIRIAHKNLFGKSVIPSYSFDKASILVSIGADFISNWLLPSKYSCDFSKTRKPENGMSRHYQFESVLSLSGANADYRSQIKPSQEGITASSILAAIKGESFSEVYNESTTEKIRKCAKDLKSNKGKSLVISGSNDPNVQTIVAAINDELNNYGATIDFDKPLHLFQADDSEVNSLIKEIESNEIQALFIYGVNPVYSMPNGEALAEHISKIPLTVSFSEYEDETSSFCKYICPDHNYLESWCDHEPISGHVSLQQPIIRPLYNTRQAQESLLVWAGIGERKNAESQLFYDYIIDFWTKNNLVNNQEDWNWAVHNGFTNRVISLAKEQVETINETNESKSNNTLVSFSLNDAFEAVQVNAEKSSDWEFTIYQNELGLGNHAANPWLQELPDSITKVVWDNYITMSPSDCYELFSINSNDPKAAWDGIHLGQEEPAFVAIIKANDIVLKLPVYPLPGQTKGTVGISFGYGRGGKINEKTIFDIGNAAFQCDEKGEHLVDANGGLIPIGANAFKLSSFVGNNLSYNGNAEISLTNEKYPLATTQTHHTIMGRTSIVKETTFDFWQKNSNNPESYNPIVKLHSHKQGGHEENPATDFSLWEEHPVKEVGHRWGMSIDLSSCNGCGVCITACHSENNVPVVGKDEVRRARDMHWLRMDRYFSSIEDDNRESYDKSNSKIGESFDYGKLEVPEDNPSVAFMPMLCQHCNHAPCETVCPVAATTHSNEGLNMMTYNRCIGTRYCANNCPYKVRRFNWFNYRDYKKFKNVNPNQDQMARLVLNPDVVVRSRGVMEKCSFCIQSIQEAKLKAKKESRALVDGDVKCACGDACPNDCIVFGDWNDPNSKIREVSQNDRAYQALEEVGVEPNIWYQVKVRNIEEENDVAINENHHSEH